MNMPLGTARPPGAAAAAGPQAGTDGTGSGTAAGAGPGAPARTDRAGGTAGGADDGSDNGTDGRVDGTAQEPSGPSLDDGTDDGDDTDPGAEHGVAQDTAHDTAHGGDHPVGSAEWDLLTDAVHWNAETYLLLGCDPDHGPLSLDRLPDRLPEADRPLLRRMMTDALVHGRPAAGTLRIRSAGGRHDDVECAGEPVLGTDGTVTALRMLLRRA
ncbi:hypothetical protein AB0O91_31760 [Kitasatospora sp. NPDC089797]|uniref:hypothetical protein n=1 Tax=Kitasatospora sp. NPDC089797 TaxID=3155298 RepID=UPI0034247B64